MPSVPADTQCSNISSPIGKAPPYTLTSLPLLVCSLQVITRPQWRRGFQEGPGPLQSSWRARNRWFGPLIFLQPSERSVHFGLALPVVTNYPIINHYCRKFPISHPHTVAAPKRGLWWVEPPGRRAGKAAGDLAFQPCKIAARFAPIVNVSSWLVSGRFHS